MAPDGEARRRPTMKDVAALARVSIKTVSRVINREPNVSPEVKARVLDAIDLVGYRPNLTASSLRRADRRTATIGLVFRDSASPFFSAVHRAVEDAARQRDVLVLAGSSDEVSEREQALLRAFLSRGIDGLIVVPAPLSQHQSEHLRAHQLGTPVIYLDRPAALIEADSVTVDNGEAARTAVRHLVAHGHQRIAFLSHLRSTRTAVDRRAGYVDGLAAAAIPPDPHLIRQDIQGVEDAEEVALQLLDSEDPPTALFTAQGIIAIGAIRALHRRGLQHRVALISFDDFPLADLVDPGLSVVAQDPRSLGRTAAELLFARIDGDRSPAKHVMIPTRLIPRGSGEIPGEAARR
jgi:LacI family transcriptional regulator